MKKQLKRSLALTLSLVLSFTGLPLLPSAHGETIPAPPANEDVADATTLQPPQTAFEQDVDKSYTQTDGTDTSDPSADNALNDLDGDITDAPEEENQSEAAVDEVDDAGALEVDDSASDDGEALVEDPEVDDALEEDAVESTEDSTEVLESETTADEDVIEAVTTDAGKANESQSAKETPTKKTLSLATQKNEVAPSIIYRSHIQNIGWQKWKKNGALSGTSKKTLRVEAVRIRLKNASGSVAYSTYVQNEGWVGQAQNGKTAGTVREGKPLEAVRIKLEGAIAKTHDVWYRTRMQKTGWQGWVKNNMVAGAKGKGRRLLALEVLLVKKGDAVPTSAGSSYTSTPTPSTPTVYYQANIQGTGWQAEKSNGKMAGTKGQSKQIETLRIALRGISGGISYRTYVQGSEWQSWRKNGALAGTIGKSKRIEAIQVKLTGAAKKHYDVWYRCHVQDIGWMNWTKNGAEAGSVGCDLRMEAFQVKLKPKDSAAPSTASTATSAPFLSVPTVSYRAYLSSGKWQATRRDGKAAGKAGMHMRQFKASLEGTMDGGIQYAICSNAGEWQSSFADGAVAGDATKNLTALRIELTGSVAELCDVWYRVRVSNYGWLGWTRNGADAGSDSGTCPIEAVKVRIARKGTIGDMAGSPYYYTRRLNGVDISGWNEGIDIASTEAQFFIIKATEGVSTPGKPATRYNPWYTTWADQALATGRQIGFYHYANGGDAVKEADEFYDAIKAYKGRAIACLDWEGDGNKLFDTGMDVAWCKKFLDRLKSKYGGTPYLYTSKNYTNAYNWTTVAKTYPLWGAQYPDFEDVLGYQLFPWQSSEPWGAWGALPTIFQYTGTGKLEQNGGNEYFDFDLFYGSTDDWATYLQ